MQDWHGKFGFLRCDDIPGKIFLHSKDIKEGREFVGEGRRQGCHVIEIYFLFKSSNERTLLSQLIGLKV